MQKKNRISESLGQRQKPKRMKIIIVIGMESNVSTQFKLLKLEKPKALQTIDRATTIEIEKAGAHIYEHISSHHIAQETEQRGTIREKKNKNGKRKVVIAIGCINGIAYPIAAFNEK